MSSPHRPPPSPRGKDATPLPAAIPPNADGATFRDLLIFEERLKQNAARLLRRKRKYQSILTLLCGAILFLSYHVVLVPKPHPVVHYAQMALLIVCGTTVFLFFASGMYTERIVAANRFVPQANRSLRPFNMYLNTRRAPSKTWIASLVSFLSSSSEATLPAAAGTTAQSRLVRTPADPSSPNSTPTVRRVQVPPIPPSTNPRGEIIFSTKVAPTFREGYERYRNAFERRRKEKLEAAGKGQNTWWRRLWIVRLLRLDGGSSAPSNEKPGRPGSETPQHLEAGMAASTGQQSGRFQGTEKARPSSGGSSGGTRRQPHPHHLRTGSNAGSSRRPRTDSEASLVSNASISSNHSGTSRASQGLKRVSLDGSSSASGSSSGHGNYDDATGSPPTTRGPRKRSTSPKVQRKGPGGSAAAARRESAGSSSREAPTFRGSSSPPLAKSGEGLASARLEPVGEGESSERGAPDAEKVADRQDDRSDAEATLREPEPEPEPVPVPEPERDTLAMSVGEAKVSSDAGGNVSDDTGSGAEGEWVEVQKILSPPQTETKGPGDGSQGQGS